MTRRRLSVAEWFLRSHDAAYVEQPSDRERTQHFQERAAQDSLKPARSIQVFPARKSAPVGKDQGAVSTNHQEVTLMTATRTVDEVAVKRDWYELHDDLVGTMDWALGEGELDLSDLREYVSEPWHFDHLYAGWRRCVLADHAADLRADARMEAA